VGLDYRAHDEMGERLAVLGTLDMALVFELASCFLVPAPTAVPAAATQE
jgi:hypothetical protein